MIMEPTRRSHQGVARARTRTQPRPGRHCTCPALSATRPNTIHIAAPDARSVRSEVVLTTSYQRRRYINDGRVVPFDHGSDTPTEGVLPTATSRHPFPTPGCAWVHNPEDTTDRGCGVCGRAVCREGVQRRYHRPQPPAKALLRAQTSALLDPELARFEGSTARKSPICSCENRHEASDGASAPASSACRRISRRPRPRPADTTLHSREIEEHGLARSNRHPVTRDGRNAAEAR